MSTSLPFFEPVGLLACGGALAAQRELTGTVVDQSGRAVPRAYVRVIDASRAESAGVFSDELGRFSVGFVDSDCSSLQPPILEHPSYSTWDARLSFTVVPQAAILLSIDNLTNADYLEPLGYRALGRAVRLGLRVGF